MAQPPEIEEEPPQIRLLRRLSMLLMVVLILGFVAMVSVIVIRLGLSGGAEAVAVDQLTIGADEAIVATGQGPETVHLVVRLPGGAEVLRVFDAGTGEMLSETAINRRAD